MFFGVMPDGVVDKRNTSSLMVSFKNISRLLHAWVQLYNKQFFNLNNGPHTATHKITNLYFPL